MHPVDEYARLKAEIRRLEARAKVLRDGFLGSDAPLRSNRHHVVVKTQNRRVFLRDRLPAHILTDPQYWEMRQSPIVTVRELPSVDEDDFQVLEDF